MHTTVRRQRTVDTDVQLLSPSHLVWDIQRMLLPTFRVGFPSSAKPLWKHPHLTHPECLQMILNAVKLMRKAKIVGFLMLFLWRDFMLLSMMVVSIYTPAAVA